MNENLIGKAFEGWETDGVLGSGTFGTVYLAHTTVENMPVYGAIKVIKIPPTDDAIANAEKMGISRDLLKTYFGKFKTDLSWETTMYKTLSSPNLVPVEELKTEDHPGAGWTGYIRTGVFTPMEAYFEKVQSGNEDAVRLGAELSSALMTLHGKKLVHGDIRPENVMVADNGSFLLSDFALKRCLQKAGANLFGSMPREFEAPELQEEEKVYTPATDIYSLGMLMSYVANDCALTISGEPENVEGLDPKLSEIIKKACAADPSERYASADELNKAITSLELYKTLKPHRRAVAAAASFELVKKNGSTIRGTSVPSEKIKFPNDPFEEKKKKRNGIIGKIASVAITVAAVAALVWFVAADPAGMFKGPGDSGTVIKENGDGAEDKQEITIVVDEPEPEPTPENPGTDQTEPTTQPENPEPAETEPSNPSGQQENPEPVEPEPEPTPEPEPEPEPVYLLPTDKRIIKYSELEGFDKRTALLALNEVYARHGRAFKTDWIREYFESQSWYKATTKSDAKINAELSKTENENLKTINKYLKDKGYR